MVFSQMMSAVWRYRSFILGSVKREFQSKYRNSLLGATWMVLNPLAMIIVYTVIFSQLMKARLPGVTMPFAYSIYLCAGVLTWGLFSEIVSKAQNVFVDNAGLLKKLSFPRLCLPVIVIANGLVNFSIVFGLFTIFIVFSGHFPGVVYLGIFPLLVLLVLFAIGLGITIGVLNVFFRDVGQFFGIVLQFWFWLTPIVYVSNVLPEKVQNYLRYNPMVPIIESFQTIFVHAQWPDWGGLWLVTLETVFLCVIGLRLFRKHVGEMVDEL
ncbi:putative O-antigen export system permease protein RfbA [Advenella mimigardefordensis DPN7]|uniref:Transport permease protein n=2 Tax=Advenella mimigardefordensis TaxID=302406 RepID=W0P7G9_ADVMD|nr:putative O-antigen export system permease protein RfbA [Advenella mimigardefordensis DPN7]